MMNKKDLKSLKNDKQAVSPVIGVILMVAITVILAAVIAAFVFGVSPAGVATPSVQLRASYEETDNKLTLKHMGGDPISLDECTVRAKGADCSFAANTNLTVGQSATTSSACSTAGPGDAVTVEVIHDPSQSYILDTTITAT